MIRKRRHLRRASGTINLMDIERALFRSPSRVAKAALADQEALRRGEGRVVVCWLRGPVDVYPHEPKQGMLELTQNGIAWRPYWGIRRRPISINEHIQSMKVQCVDHEWHVKKGLFQVVVCTTDRGILEFAVPIIDMDLVQSALTRR